MQQTFAQLQCDAIGPESLRTSTDVDAEIEKSRGRAPKPPPSEQKGRLARACAALEQQGLDALLVFGSAGANPEPIRYLSGYVHVFPNASSFLVLPREAAPVLLIDQSWHLGEAVKMSWIEDIRSFPNGARRWLADELRSTLQGAIVDSGLDNGRIGIFDVVMPTVYAAVLRNAAPSATFVDGTEVWEDLVSSPSEYDREMIRAAARVADEGLAGAVEAAQQGATEYEVCMESLRHMAANGAEFLHGSGASTHVNIGSHSEVISNVRPFLFSGNRLEKGQMFWLDLTASCAGYYIDCDRTISVGEPSPDQQRLYDVTARMYDAMVVEARGGMTGGELWEIGNNFAVEAGYQDYSNHVYLGHTTGLTTSERPVLARGETKQLRTGSFLNVEPGVFVPGLGSACIENTLEIREDGATVINNFGIEIHVV